MRIEVDKVYAGRKNTYEVFPNKEREGVFFSFEERKKAAERIGFDLVPYLISGEIPERVFTAMRKAGYCRRLPGGDWKFGFDSAIERGEIVQIRWHGMVFSQPVTYIIFFMFFQRGDFKGSFSNTESEAIPFPFTKEETEIIEKARAKNPPNSGYWNIQKNWCFPGKPNSRGVYFL